MECEEITREEFDEMLEDDQLFAALGLQITPEEQRLLELIRNHTYDGLDMEDYP